MNFPLRLISSWLELWFVNEELKYFNILYFYINCNLFWCTHLPSWSEDFLLPCSLIFLCLLLKIFNNAFLNWVQPIGTTWIVLLFRQNIFFAFNCHVVIFIKSSLHCKCVLCKKKQVFQLNGNGSSVYNRVASHTGRRSNEKIVTFWVSWKISYQYLMLMSQNSMISDVLIAVSIDETS